MKEKVSLTLSLVNYGGWSFALRVSTNDRTLERILQEMGFYVRSNGIYERTHNFQRAMRLVGKEPYDYGLEGVLENWHDGVLLDKVQRLLDVKDEIMEDIVTYISKTIEIVSKERTKRVVELIPESPRSSTVPKRRLSQRTFIQIGNTVYEAELRKVKDIENIDELPELIEQKVREELEVEYAAVINSLKQEISELRQRLEEARVEVVKEAWAYFADLFRQGWEVNEEGKLALPRRIYAKYVVKKDGNKLITYRIPDQHMKFFVEGIVYDPEWNTITVERAFNPHVDESVCTGDYRFNLESLDRVIEMFETINMDSMYPNRAAEEITRLFNEGKLIKVKEEVIAYAE